MRKRLLLLLGLVLSATFAFAQDDYQFESENDSVECRKNTTFFKVHAKAKNYEDAYTFWKKVYDQWPGSSKDIYIVGVDILKWKIDEATTADERDAALHELLEMYDNRIKYFGDDPKVGVDYILGSKVEDYMKYMGNNTDYDLIYSWLDPVVREMKEETDPYTLSQYTYASMARMINNQEQKAQYVDDHLMVDGFYDAKIAELTEAGDEKGAKYYAGFKADGQALFASSGAASCEMMQEIYGPQVVEKKNDQQFLENVIKTLRQVGCTESDVFFVASENLYNLKPSASAARGIALKAFRDKDYARAEKFFLESIDLSDSKDDRGESYYLLAVINYEQNRFSAARSYANQAMQEKDNFGAPMLLIANMYAASAKSIYPDDPVKQRIVYCLVVDKCQRARAMDPTVSNEASSMISRFSSHFPRKEDVFMHPDLEAGSTFHVGGWIGETTTIRVID